MTPVQVIELGIAQGDLEAIARGFNALTGRNVTPPSPAGKVDEDQRAVEALQWYANVANYSMESGAIPVMLDEGKKARAVFPGTFEFNMPKVLPNQKQKKPQPKKEKTAKQPKTKTPSVPAGAQPTSTRITPVAGRNWDPPPGNKFKPNSKDAAKDIKFTKKVCERIELSERRPPHNDPEVEVTCDNDGCGRKFKCRQSEAKTARSEDQIGMENYCPRCLRG